MKYFFAGIKGSGMAGLACMLKNLGNDVIGCDDTKVYTFTEDSLYENDIKVYKDAYFLTSDMIFIYTAAIHEDHYAYKKAKELNCKMYGDIVDVTVMSVDLDKHRIQLSMIK